MNYSDRFENFQREAVENVVADFSQNPAGRFLLVIPTGGGKTTTAVKAVHALYGNGQLLAAKDRVMWVVHRDELRRQATDAFDNFAARVGAPQLPALVDVMMLSQVPSYLDTHRDARFAVIDEAHHVAAKSYHALFSRTSLGILGLTATPSRHDGQPLQFDRESYPLDSPISLAWASFCARTSSRCKAAVMTLGTSGMTARISRHSITSIATTRSSKRSNTTRTNSTRSLSMSSTKKHARDIYARLKTSSLRDSYEDISLILGDERRRWTASTGVDIANESREAFIKAQKAAGRSILVNVDVLTEGYDDPTVNAVVMARPTSSKLVYMQALGRAVRMDPDNPDKDAYVVEVVDSLPNIRYRIDNRWLFSDIADTLEPAVLDVTYATPDERLTQLHRIYDQYNVAAQLRALPTWQPRDRLTMLLFRVSRHRTGTNTFRSSSRTARDSQRRGSLTISPLA